MTAYPSPPQEQQARREPLRLSQAAAPTLPQGEAATLVRRLYDATLEPDLAVHLYSNTHRLFPTRVVCCGPQASPLPQAEMPLPPLRFRSRGTSYDLYDYLAVNRVAGLLVLKDGAIAAELHALGTGPSTRWMSMSVAKSVTSTLLGAALQQGALGSLDDLVTAYVPALRGTAYDGPSVRDILRMTSGVRWDETYTDPASDRRRLLEAHLQLRPGAMLEYMARRPAAAPPGTLHTYSTGETLVAAAIVRGATSRHLADFLAETIWQPCGMEADAAWWLDAPGGCEIGGSGLCATLRDYGRFGLFVMRGGRVGGVQHLPAGWLEEACAPQCLPSGQRLEYGYSWWPSEPETAETSTSGVLVAEGIFGQYIFIHPRERVVIVGWSARSKPNGMDIVDDQDFCLAVVEALRAGT